MLAYIIRRVLYMIPTILAVALLVFLLFHEVGEDPVRVALGPHASAEKIAALKAKWGLTCPCISNSVPFLKEIVSMDFGRSYVTDEKLSGLFKEGACIPFVDGPAVYFRFASKCCTVLVNRILSRLLAG